MKYILAGSFFCVCISAAAQTTIKGTVLDSETGEPVAGAVVSVPARTNEKILTDINGCFSLALPENASVSISYMGYKPLTVKVHDNAVYRLVPDVHNLNEVVVTAQEAKGLSSASTIKRHAMEHIQPSSFADLLALLPGERTTDPQLNQPNTIRLREADPLGANYATSSLGTSFVIDGAPVSTNANMQRLDGAFESSATSRNFMNAGVDMRSISTDDIESVEIIRGIPSVEYGDLTSGLVKIERKKGGKDLTGRLKADMDGKLFYLAKGLEWKHHWGMNISLDYLNSKADPRNTLENYQRVTASARTYKTWSTPARTASLNINLDFGSSIDNDKVDPDLNYGTNDTYKSSYNRWALAAIFNLKARHSSFFKELGVTMSSFYEKDLISRTRLVQLSRDTPAPLNQTTGESDAVLLPYKYEAAQSADGRPFNAFIKASATFGIPSATIFNALKAGVEWNMDKNYGKGQVFDLSRPVYPEVSTRPRLLSSIPATHTLALYAEENLKYSAGRHLFELTGGVRAQQMLHLPGDYAMHSRVYWDPRVNAGWTLPQMHLGKTPVLIRFSGGIGQHTKNPTVDQLYPDPLYIDFVEMNYFHTNSDYRRIRLMTYVEDPVNRDLQPARNRKWEVSTDITIGGNRLSVTFFHENMTSGFRTQTLYRPYTYKKYDTSGIDAGTLTGPPAIENLPYTMVSELSGLSTYTNGSQTLKQGIEYTFESVRLQKLMTRLTITGAWFKTTYRNSQPVMERPGVVIDNKAYQYAGIYNDNDGYVNEMANTNFTLDTDVPRLRLGVSLSAQCLWFTSSRRLPVSNIPDSYMDEQGRIHPFTAADADDTYLRYLIRNYTESLFQRYKVPFSMNVNLKVTKKLLKDHLKLAMFCNKIIDYTPDYESNGMTIRRHVTPYFGLEINFIL